MTEEELKTKLQELEFITKDGVEWSRYVPGTGRVAARFNYQIYKTREVRVNLDYKVEIHEDSEEFEDNAYERAFRHVSEILIEHILTS